MATHHGKEGLIKVGADTIGEVTGFTIETTADVVEDTSLTDATKSFLTGRTSFSGSIEMHYDEGDTVQQTLLAGTAITFVFQPEGATTGDETLTGACLVTGMSISNAMDGVVSRTVTVQGTGALTIGTAS